MERRGVRGRREEVGVWGRGREAEERENPGLEGRIGEKTRVQYVYSGKNIGLPTGSAVHHNNPSSRTTATKGHSLPSQSALTLSC